MINCEVNSFPDNIPAKSVDLQLFNLTFSVAITIQFKLNNHLLNIFIKPFSL